MRALRTSGVIRRGGRGLMTEQRMSRPRTASRNMLLGWTRIEVAGVLVLDVWVARSSNALRPGLVVHDLEPRRRRRRCLRSLVEARPKATTQVKTRWQKCLDPGSHLVDDNPCRAMMLARGDQRAACTSPSSKQQIAHLVRGQVLISPCRASK
ncbi:hypothetical protein BGZ61DRAFT_135350 [Ilyonectria robusta]|uniref:uncharacterized protein n=1 Tax=Ilyonectria robusta TaxID=1079257 RepID=UPI001E8D91D9|nr:uncharacterized protein BGZ61DRAFT_135350 [Ilyonectria robusta]KAH8735115.1 hypothetical protein BGZ61DRAFT_135350 [Ilyonectria robusta]